MYKGLLLLWVFLSLQTKESEIAWSADYKLQWSNFKGAPNMNSDAAATTASGITFGYRMSETDGQITQFKADVTAHFYPDKSWYKPEEVSNHILEHEQLHFDITELHARILRQHISKLQVPNSVNKELENWHQHVLKDLGAMQNAYDAASDFSRNKEQQTHWKETVTKQLAELKAFAKQD
ncbi:hypothetical protein C1T31_04660 [Hanstruepera neustonica]|uniref:DUF922 domain-containing protein n=1 Tax=Hanstruepera neustonica TaxID=1445657 RepID=A0A2K1E056_9FLAO|nr:hypothetical protein [Hanstruepera neustonica]PNQ73634.1 hypothetical protein C1T31_04660 [Hanstruepera neustonica]